MSQPTERQAELDQIPLTVQIEQVKRGVYRSTRLWRPVISKGVFGGVVISQACAAATECVDPTFVLHSTHCYFVTTASSDIPILYSVEQLGQGRNFVTCSVKATQEDRQVMSMLCSFQNPREPWQPTHQWPIPESIPPIATCEREEDRCRRVAAETDNKAYRKTLELMRVARIQAPIEVRHAGKTNLGDHEAYVFWVKARGTPKYDARYQKCVAAYMTDFHFLHVAPYFIGLEHYTTDPNGLAATPFTLNHAVHFFETEFDVNDWLLYVVSCPRAGSGRSLMHGQLFTRDGKLIAFASQEGTVRGKPPQSKL